MSEYCENCRVLQKTIAELEAAPTKANVMVDTIKAMSQDITRLKATITELTAALDRIGHAEYISTKPIGWRDQATIVQAELDARIDYARAALQEKDND